MFKLEHAEQHLKIFFPLTGDETGLEVETLWAVALGEDKYRIDNCPFFAYKISCGDIVYAPKNKATGNPTFGAIIAKSGNRTLRILFDVPLIPGNITEEILQNIKNKGCGYEGYSNKYFSINIPGPVDYSEICEYLVKMGVEWEDADR